MENFISYNPTKVHFGKAAVRDLGSTASDLGKVALLVYGKGSVMRNGSYRDTLEQLQQAGMEIIEYSGIKPNPVVEDVDRAANLGREKKADMVVAVGGGSAIDSAKVIAVCVAENCGGWEVMTGKVKISRALPILAILTLAATATEMNPIAVIQNDRTREKFGYSHPTMFPRHSFLDPSYTFTVPAEHTAYGIVDLIAHALEAYFGQGEASLSDRFVESILLEAMEFGPLLLQYPGDYELRARMMWAATNALNGLAMAGRGSGDYTSHALGHQLSLLYDTPHGASLAISMPAWMKHMKPRIGKRIEKLGARLFGHPSADRTIRRLEDFFREVGCPIRLKDIGLSESNKAEILELMNRNDCNAKNPENRIGDRDRGAIVDLMMTG